MAKEKGQLAQVLESCARWIEARWKGTGLVILWAGSVLTVFIAGAIQLSDRIQAALMITLVIVTLFYAGQTRALVKEEQRALEEEKKKRAADFGMRRIKDFLFPVLDSLESLKDSVSRVAEAPKNPLGINFIDALGIFNAHLNGVKKFIIEYLYMTNPMLRYGYLKIVKMTMPNPIERQSEEFIAQWKKTIDENIDELITAIKNEITRICQDIRKTYGFISRDPESRESQDDLTVLSSKPPARI